MELPVAVSPLTAGLLSGEPRRGVVLACFPTATYLRVEDDAGRAQVLPVVSCDALLLPTAARLGLPSAHLSWPLGVGDPVLVGGGRISGSGLELRSVRAWRPGRVERASGRPAGGVVGLLPEGGVLAELCADLTAGALAGERVDDHVAGLVGAGLGLTPSGDDALCGVLLALRAWAPSIEPLAAAARAVDRYRHRTTDLSASLLGAAAVGYAVPEVVSLVQTLSASGPEGLGSLDERLAAVLAIGHTSGRDLVAGLAGAVRALTHHHHTPDRQSSKSDRQCSKPHRVPSVTPEGITRA